MTTPASRRPCSMVRAPLPGAQVRAPCTPGDSRTLCRARRPGASGTVQPCTLDLPGALAVSQAGVSRASVPWPAATCTWDRCSWPAARRPSPSAAASAPLSGGNQVSEAASGSPSGFPSQRCRRSPRLPAREPVTRSQALGWGRVPGLPELRAL